ncbi:DNA cytosine methyltransferase [Brevibacillus agri]|uniref:DNA cytosine methyltransferase n=1 Tax=Brevibacillus agri TaxID=51101 RepID=UPI0018CDA5BB
MLLGHVVQADIKTFDKSRITKAPVMIGGSPCQGFSNSNRYTNYLDNPNNKLVEKTA